MNIFGRQVSVAVLISYIASLATIVAGAWSTIASNWRVNPALAIGAGWMVLNTAVHTWDTQTGQPAPVPPTPPAAA